MRRAIARITVVGAVIAGTLVPAMAAPVTTISIPTTLARTVHVLSEHHHSAPLDFSATHVAFSWTGPKGSAIRYRTSTEDGHRSEWVQAPETHGTKRSERTGRHYSAVLAVDHAVRVEWSGTGRGAERIERVTLDYLNTLDGPRREVRVPVVAEAADGPPIVTRAQWGADEKVKRTSGGCTRRFFPLQQVFVHHTAGQNYDSNPKATMRAIYWFHVVRQGWCDIGYNFVIAADGTVFEGRWARRYKPWELHDAESSTGRVVAGAHTEGYNSGSLGVSLMGNYSQISLPPAARRSLVELLAWEVDRHDLAPRRRHSYRNPESGGSRNLYYISGHRDAGQTACPGSFVYKDLSEIRREVAVARGTGRASSRIGLSPVAGSVGYGETASFTGTLTDAEGAGLVGRPVTSYVREANRRWKVGPQTISGENGNFQLDLEISRNTRVIALYEGDAATWGAQSRPARVRVAPFVSIEAEGGTPDAAGISHHPSGTEIVYLSGVVDPPHVNRSVVVQVARLESDGEYHLVSKSAAEIDDSSLYRYPFVVPDDGGTFQASAVFRADEDHGSSRSDVITFVVDP